MTAPRPSRTLWGRHVPGGRPGQSVRPGRGSVAGPVRTRATGHLDDAEQLVRTPRSLLPRHRLEPGPVVRGERGRRRSGERVPAQGRGPGTARRGPHRRRATPATCSMPRRSTRWWSPTTPSGSLSVLRLRTDGLPEGDGPDQTISLHGHGPRADRQESSHAPLPVARPRRATPAAGRPGRRPRAQVPPRPDHPQCDRGRHRGHPARRSRTPARRVLRRRALVSTSSVNSMGSCTPPTGTRGRAAGRRHLFHAGADRERRGPALPHQPHPARRSTSAFRGHDLIAVHSIGP